MRTAIGLLVAFGLFTASFVLHIVGGSLDQGWLFGLAVALIYLFATGFGAVAWIAAGARIEDKASLLIGTVAALGLTMAALWAANDRSLAWWQWFAAPPLVALSTSTMLGAWLLISRRRERAAGRTPAA